jgi:glycerophosphoryl diester phosphodiesterase
MIVEALRRRPFSIVGHRGAAGLAPENTLAAIRAGMEAGVDAVEVDVQLTADGVPVLSHDDDLRRVAGLDVSVRRSKLVELRRYRVGGHPIPTLEEALSLVDGRVGVLVEVKHPEDTPTVIDTLKSMGATEWAALISFYEEAVAEAASRGLVAGLIYARPPGKIVEARRLGARIVLPRYNLATPRAVALAHRLGLTVVAWTVNRPEDAVKLVRAGADAIASDRPDALAELRRRLGS